jgi:hypothetical protein
MKIQKILLMSLMAILLVSPVAVTFAAGEFAWVNDFNIKADSNLADFKARVGIRFNIGNAQIDAILKTVHRAADAYMVLRYGEISGKSIKIVIEQYKSKKKNGWGALAKSLGIKPGSKEFKALKDGDDLYNVDKKDKKKNKSKSKGKKKN